MSKELQAWQEIKLGYICGQGAINEFSLKEKERENLKIIESALKEREVMEVMKQTKIVVSDPKVSDEDFEKLKNQGILTNLQCEIKPLFDEETQKKLKALEIIKEKEVDVRGINVSSAANEYNNWFSKRLENNLTKEEYKLLQEVLK